MQGRTAIPFRVILALALLIRLLFLVAAPLGEAVSHHIEGLNDEPAHLNYVAYLATHRTLPVQTRHSLEPGAFDRGDFEYYQPPLFYVLCAPIYALAGERYGLYACRLVSFVCGILTLVVFGMVLERLGCSAERRRLAVAFLALLPAHAYFSSMVSNDSLTWLIGMVLVEQVLAFEDDARFAPHRIGLGTHVRLGLLLGLGVMTKPSMAIFFPLAIFFYWYAYRRTRRARVATGALVALGVAMVVAGPWHLRNIELYGSPIPLSVGFGPASEGDVVARLVHAVRATARYFWFPMQHVGAAGVVHALRAVGGMILVAHAAAAVWYLRRPDTLNVKTVSLALLLLLALTGQVRVDLLWMAVEGRFIFPALAAIGFFLVVPTAAWLEHWKRSERFIWTYFCLLALHPYLFLPYVGLPR